MRKTFTLLIALLALTVSSWATTVTWDGTDLSNISLNCPNVGDKFESASIDGIKASLERTGGGSYCYFNLNNNGEVWITGGGELTFISSVGDITGIVITCSSVGYTPSSLPTGWVYDGSNTIT